MNKTEFINELAKRTDRPVTEMYKFVNDCFTLTTEIQGRPHQNSSKKFIIAK